MCATALTVAGEFVNPVFVNTEAMEALKVLLLLMEKMCVDDLLATIRV